MATLESGQANSSLEKDGALPGYSAPAHEHGHQEGAVRSENWFTRNGLNLESFKKRDYGHGLVELDRSMKPRHLHMIAIGGSIGAGFFVGSGGALAKGGPGSLLIDFLIIGIMMFNVGESQLTDLRSI
jgi:yeast amino acid transporter